VVTELQRGIEVLVVINFAVIGVSHVVAARAWGEFFQWLQGKGEAGVFCVAFLSLSFGSMIAAFHPVWSGVPMIVTLLGWAQVVKGALYFTFPRLGLRMLAQVSPEKSWKFRPAGFVALLLTVLLGWHLWHG
jgi:uncharacterized protein YjeT (DUF2065 family)